MTYQYRFTLYFISLLVFLFLQSCNNQTTIVTGTEIPALLDRSEKIQLGKEWDFVQNMYSNKVQSIIANPNDDQAKLVLAQLFIKEARITGEHGHYYPSALQMLNQILYHSDLKVDTKFLALLHKAGVELSLHEFTSALETAKKAIVLNPHNAQIHGVLVDCYVELGDYDKAIAIADKMASMKPDLRSYSRISYLREIHGDIDGAIDAMGLAIKAGYPGYEETAWAMQTLGELYQRYGQIENAKKVFEDILVMRPNYPFAVASLADIQSLKGDVSSSEKKLEEAISIIPEVGFYISLAHIYKDQKRFSELKKIKSEILEMLEDDVVHGHNMNLEYTDLYLSLFDEPETALSYIQKEYEKRPHNIDVNRMMAKVYQKLNDINSSKMYAEAASITNSAHPDLKDLRALLN